MKNYYVYILTNNSNSMTYIGVTSNLSQRLEAHSLQIGSKFTSKFHLNKLVYFEVYRDVYTAIAREKKLKKWRREWKYNLIKSVNPGFESLNSSLI